VLETDFAINMSRFMAAWLAEAFRSTSAPRIARGILATAGRMPAGPTAKMAVLQRKSQCDLIGKESRLRNSWSDVGIPDDPFTNAADLAELSPFRFFFAGRSCSFTRDRRFLWSWPKVDCLFMTS
jgi:hypothetical protein